MLRIPLAMPGEVEERKQYAARVAEAEKQLQQLSDRYRRDFAKDQLKETAKYLLAAWEYQHAPTGQTTLAEFARRNDLREFALRQWLEVLGADQYQLMLKPISNAANTPGVHGWRGRCN